MSSIFWDAYDVLLLIDYLEKGDTITHKSIKALLRLPMNFICALQNRKDSKFWKTHEWDMDPPHLCGIKTTLVRVNSTSERPSSEYILKCEYSTGKGRPKRPSTVTSLKKKIGWHNTPPANVVHSVIRSHVTQNDHRQNDHQPLQLPQSCWNSTFLQKGYSISFLVALVTLPSTVHK